MASSGVVVRVLDGEDTIGGSKILVGWDGAGVFLDFGINYGRWGRFFEEYVKPRTSRGLGDLWKLGLVPRVPNLYRPDVVPAGLPSDQDLPVQSVGGVFVSHAHLDHAGLAGLLARDIPLVCSRTSAAILKAVQDTQNANVFSQSVYMTPYRLERVAGQSVFASAQGDLVGRDCFLTDGAGSDGFRRFWERPPNESPKARRGLAAGALRVHQPSSGGLPVQAFEVDHSVLGSGAFSIETPNGPIAYSGDLRAHGQRADRTRAFLDGLKRRRPWILLMEGTQVRPESHEHDEVESVTDEAEVEKNCLDTVERFRGQLVVADFAPRNVERLLAFLRIAQRTGRRLVIVPKDAYLLHAMNAADAKVPVPHDRLLIVDVPSASAPQAWEQFILHEFASHVVHMEDVRARQAEFILAFSYFDIKHLLDVEPDRGCYIYSSSEAHSEEQEIDMERLSQWLDVLHLSPVGFRMQPDPRRPGRRRALKVPGFHASGHMPGHEILEWVRAIAPEHLLPVHTEGRDAFARAFEGTGVKILKGGFG